MKRFFAIVICLAVMLTASILVLPTGGFFAGGTVEAAVGDTPMQEAVDYTGKTIACVGDSITAAYGVKKDETDYVKLLAQKLNMNYIRLGASGTTLCTDGDRTCNIIRLTESNLKGADVVTVFMGINDFVNAGQGYYELGDVNSTDTSTVYGAMKMWCERIEELRKTESLNDTCFYFMTPVITSWNNSASSVRDWDQSKKNIHGYTLRDMCNAIIEVATLYNVDTIDLNLLSGMYYVDKEDNNVDVFGGDGVHPGETGHKMMADAIANVLLQNNLRDDHTHEFGSWITTVWPSCVEGEKQRVCTICSATESCTAASEDTHSYSTVVTPPTASQQGYTTYTCSRCSYSYIADYEDAICSGSYRWEVQNNELVSVTSDGNVANPITMDKGSVVNGTFSGVRCRLEKSVRLYHNLPWAIEWRSTGNWSGMLFGSADQSPSDNLIYLFRDTGTRLFAFGEYTGSWNNYGTIMDCDMTTPHVFRLENRIAEDGSNEIWLLIDGQEFDVMNNYYKTGSNQNKTVDWANGKDIVFANIGTSSHPVSGIKPDYIQVWENYHEHSYTAVVKDPTCVDGGYTTYNCDCGDSYVGDYTDPTGHSYENGQCVECGDREKSAFKILDTGSNQIEVFTYEVGMTWRDWLNSPYNTGMGSCIAVWVSAGPDILGGNPYIDIYVNGSPAYYDSAISEEAVIELIKCK